MDDRQLFDWVGFPDRLRGALNMAELSGEEAGRRMGQGDGSQISHWLAGRRRPDKNNRALLLGVLGQKLEISASWLYNRSGDAPRVRHGPLVEADRDFMELRRTYRVRRIAGAAPSELRAIRQAVRAHVAQIVTSGRPADEIIDLMTDGALGDDEPPENGQTGSENHADQ